MRTASANGFISLATALLYAVCSPNAFATGYLLVDMGSGVEPADINEQRIAVGTLNTGQYPTSAFRFSTTDGVTVLPVGVRATAINDAGAIAGATTGGSFFLDGDGNVTEWSGYGAYGMNDTGQICGNKTMPNPHRPFPLPLAPALFTDGQWDFLDVARTYPRGNRLGIYADVFVLLDINANGASVGSKSRYGLTGTSAILVEAGFDTVTYLPTANGGSANAINNQNAIVGATGSGGYGVYPRAFLYRDGNVTDLGTLAGGLSSHATDINERNQVVGGAWLVTTPTSVYDPTQYHAFVWQDGQMTDLNELAGSAGWVLTEATAINNRGDIAGTGLRNGVVHGFVLLATDAPDADGDGVADTSDNCTDLPNPEQIDSNNDGFGNACDPDLNDDGIVNAADLGLLRQAFFSTDANADFNADGIVNTADLGILRSFFFLAPGPSGIVN